MLSDPAGPAVDLLDAVLARYSLDDIGPEAVLPPRRHLAHGQPGQIAADEDTPLDPRGSLIVSLTGVFSDGPQGTPGLHAPAAGNMISHMASYQIRLLRPTPMTTPSGDPPAATAVTTAAVTTMRDHGRLLDALHAWAKALPDAMSVQINAVEPQGPSGGVAGCRVTASLWPL